MKYEVRKTWRNHTGNQRIEPLRIYEPGTIDEVVALVREAERLGVTARAVGSHHSWSDVALCPGFVVETRRLARVRPDLERDVLRADAVAREENDGRRLVETQAGIRLRELNAALDARGLALSNMGGYDEQTVAGVMGTSTHGSGIAFGPIASQIRSIDVVASGGEHVRVEPADGLTDRQRYEARYPDRRLVQDDEWFQSVAVSMGCMGIIVSVILLAEPAYWLTERRVLSTWSAVRQQLTTRDVLYRHRHWEVLFNPHPTAGGDHTCLITTRDPAPEPVGKPKDKLERNPLVEILSGLPLIPKLVNLLFDVKPSITPEMLDRAMKSLVDDEYTNKSYKVLNIGAANKLPAYSSEIGIPVDDRGLHVAAVDRIMEIAERHRSIGAVYSTSPVSLRFVKQSPAFMSMMYGADTVMIELIQMVDTEGGFELLAAYEEALYDLGGRPHWGQYNTLTGSHDLVRAMYPKYDRWLEVHGELNRSRVFDSPFSKRVGIAASSVRQVGGGTP